MFKTLFGAAVYIAVWILTCSLTFVLFWGIAVLRIPLGIATGDGVGSIMSLLVSGFYLCPIIWPIWAFVGALAQSLLLHHAVRKSWSLHRVSLWGGIALGVLQLLLALAATALSLSIRLLAWGIPECIASIAAALAMGYIWRYDAIHESRCA
jgi:hypothetical protein